MGELERGCKKSITRELVIFRKMRKNEKEREKMAKCKRRKGGGR